LNNAGGAGRGRRHAAGKGSRAPVFEHQLLCRARLAAATQKQAACPPAGRAQRHAAPRASARTAQARARQTGGRITFTGQQLWHQRLWCQTFFRVELVFPSCLFSYFFAAIPRIMWPGGGSQEWAAPAPKAKQRAPQRQNVGGKPRSFWCARQEL
jgi:hypothetical protein